MFMRTLQSVRSHRMMRTFMTLSTHVRPQVTRSEYEIWRETAKGLGFVGARNVLRLIRILMDFAKENPSFFRKR